MSFNTTAALKTGAVVLAVWGLCAFSDRSIIGNAIPGAGIAGMSELKNAGLQMRFVAGDYPVVEKVEAGSLADITGVKVGDKIKGVDHVGAYNQKDFAGFFKDGAKGRHLIIDRNGKIIFDRVLGEKPPVKKPDAPAYTGVPPLGMNVTDMVGMYPAGVRAPMALEPLPGSAIASAGIKAGEWILAINGKSIATAADYRQLTESDGPLTFTVLNTEKDQRHQREVKIRE